MQMQNMCRAMDVVTAQLQHTYMHDAQVVAKAASS